MIVRNTVTLFTVVVLNAKKFCSPGATIKLFTVVFNFFSEENKRLLVSHFHPSLF